MGKKELIVLWVGVGLIVLMCLFPPWVEYTESHTWGDHRLSGRAFMGYGCVFWHSVGGFEQGQGYIDTQRLTVQCIAVALLTGAGIYTLRVKGK